MGEIFGIVCGLFFIEGADKKIIVDTGGSAQTLTKAEFSASQIAEPEDALKKVRLKGVKGLKSFFSLRLE
jgi:hypothetical protein